MNEAQRQVLKMLEAGSISAEEANRLLAVLGGGNAEVTPLPAAARPETERPVEAAPAVEIAPVEAAPVAPKAPTASPVDVSALAAASSAEVLRQLAQGEISAEEADARLSEVPDAADPSEPVRLGGEPAPDFGAPPEPEPIPVADVLDERAPDMDRLRRFWQTPFLVALGIAVLSALCMSATYGAGGLLGGLGFLCGWSVFMLAVVAVGVAFWSRTARWVHVRVAEHDGRRFRISLPVPLRFMDGLLRVARPFVKGDALRHMEMTAEFLAALDEETRASGSDAPIVDVDDGGDRVQVYFG